MWIAWVHVWLDTCWMRDNCCCLFAVQGDDMPEIPPQSVTEEQYTDEHGNLVVKKVNFPLEVTAK